MNTHPVDAWHQLVKNKNPAGLKNILDDEVVFLSPIAHTPIVGRDKVFHYLAVAFSILAMDSFRYVREIRGKHDAALEFEVEMNDIYINGVDFIKWNEAGKIIEFKVMLRPLQAINLMHQTMSKLLEK